MRYDEDFSDLDTAIEGVQTHLQQEIETRTNGTVGALYRLKLAVHEWMANLVRHAHFTDRPPEVHVRVRRREAGVHCTIEDNSEGFDLEEQLRRQEDTESFREMPESGMGLLMLKSSAERVEYTPVSETQNRLDLFVRLDGENET